MVLIAQEIANRGIVRDGVEAGKRPTTYDATVGCIIQEGKEISQNNFKLAPRGIVWVISAETFDVPDNATGLATLRTTWTHDGLLALNVGIVDPGWNGPLAAAVVNFSQDSFMINKGDSFLRVVFHGHGPAHAPKIEKTREQYNRDILAKSVKFSPTFLHMDKLVSEVSDEVFSLPRWAQYIALFGFVVALLAIFVPISVSVFTDYYVGPKNIERLESEIDDLKTDKKLADETEAMKKQITDLEAAVKRLTPTPAGSGSGQTGAPLKQ